mmetsp:Transcript_36347/g.104664  ORF Transcript_36347/g.104664 Transcript_36347/m.104664 type:complete len:336 (-) Transcript_36347:236-1243(-)
MVQGAANERHDCAHDVVLTVHMEGTSNRMDAITTQIGLFSQLCSAAPLPEDGSGEMPGAGQYKLSFAGCGVSHGVTGTLFAVGLREQCQVVRRYTEAFIKAGHVVRINFVGFSRGGIGGLYLARELMDFRREQVTLNMLLFDPVPGNALWMARFADVGGFMNANQTMDVSSCAILRHVVVLYPCEPLVSWTMHAPLIAMFPPDCTVEQDVVLGCHQGALWLQQAPDTCLSFSRIRDFLVMHGSSLKRGTDHVSRGLDVTDAELAKMLDMELSITAPSTRSAHSSVPGTVIIRHENGIYLNRSHEMLLKRLGEPARPPTPGVYYYMLDVIVQSRVC